MDMTSAEVRVLGCLLEKQRTTPDQYPLTLNSLRLACNQATNRDPVVRYDEDVLREAIKGLGRRGYIRFVSGHSSRVAKYRHLLAEALPMSDAESALMCVLMLRGAQTPGELKQRTDRMHSFDGLGQVNEALEQLIDRGLVQRLDRRPGQKEERYKHRLSDDADATLDSAASATPSAWPLSTPSATPLETPSAPPTTITPDEQAAHAQAELAERVSALERELAELRARVDGLVENVSSARSRADGEADETDAPIGEARPQADGEADETGLLDDGEADEPDAPIGEASSWADGEEHEVTAPSDDEVAQARW